MNINGKEINKNNLNIKNQRINITPEKTQLSKTTINVRPLKKEKSEENKKIVDIAKENLKASKSKVSDTQKARELLSSIQNQILGKSRKAFIAHSNLDQSDLSSLLSS